VQASQIINCSWTLWSICVW